MTLAARKPLYEVAEGSVITIPSWLSSNFLVKLQRHRPLIFYLEAIGLSLAWCFGNDSVEIRVLAAVLFTLYHLVEHSETNRHGEFPILYSMWAMCLQDEEMRRACVWGIAIHFIFSAGYSKVAVGGFHSKYFYPLWMHPCTMETYLTCYRRARTGLSRPIFPRINALICRSKLSCTALSLLTIIFECTLAPASLFMDVEQRPMVCYMMITLHVGIALFMSKKVGIVFITSLPVYIYGFQSDVALGSTPWIVASTIGFGPTLFGIMVSGFKNSVCGLAENWPISPVSLFMWNGKTAQCILQLFMTGDKRMVLATTRVASKEDGLLGLRVLHQGETITSGVNEHVVHDCVMRTLSFTVVHGNEPIVEAVQALCHDPELMHGKAASKLLHRTWTWLTMERRMVEAHTGEDLTRAYFVRVNESMRITEVIL